MSNALCFDAFLLHELAQSFHSRTRIDRAAALLDDCAHLGGTRCVAGTEGKSSRGQHGNRVKVHSCMYTNCYSFEDGKDELPTLHHSNSDRVRNSLQRRAQSHLSSCHRSSKPVFSQHWSAPLEHSERATFDEIRFYCETLYQSKVASSSEYECSEAG